MTVGKKKIQPAILENISLEIKPQTILALVGGSGSGKTTTGLAILRLLPPALNIQKGKIHFQGNELLSSLESHMRGIRGKEISVVFQEPLYAFNPVFSMGSQIEEVLRFHTSFNRRQRQQKVLELLKLVEIPDPLRVVKSYPHQLSGGMRQRAMIAQAIAAGPKLLIADEPTSNLDVTLQAKIMDLFRHLKDQLKLSILLITHDLGMVSHLADEIAVMTKGRIVEFGGTQAILENPKHEYTKELLKIFR